jgi:hypothetical protein
LEDGLFEKVVNQLPAMIMILKNVDGKIGKYVGFRAARFIKGSKRNDVQARSAPNKVIRLNARTNKNDKTAHDVVRK